MSRTSKILGFALFWLAAVFIAKNQFGVKREPAAGFLDDTAAVWNNFVDDIYTSTADAGNVAFKSVASFVASNGISLYVDGLPVSRALKSRLQSKLKSDEFDNKFMDAVVPFIFALKEQYNVDHSKLAAEGFNAHARDIYLGRSSVPGRTHTLFSLMDYKKPEALKNESKEESIINDDLVAKIIEFYDVVFLQPGVSPLTEDVQVSKELLEQTKPIVKNVLVSLTKKSKGKSEMNDNLNQIVNDPDRLETVTATLLDFIQNMSYKSYHAFAMRAQRANDLRFWMEKEFNRSRSDKLWEYLKYANTGRSYAIHYIVDGLQGSLVEALAIGKKDQPFLNQLKKDIYEKNAPDVAFKNIEPIRDGFFKHLLKNGYRDVNYLPYFKKIYGRNRTTVAVSGVSSTPTISVRNLPIVKTGAQVAGEGGTGIPNFHFLDRKKNRAYYFYGNDAIALEPLTRAQGMKTMYERLTDINTLNCNAQYDRGARKSFDGFINLILGEKTRDMGEWLCYNELKLRLENEKKLRTFRQKLLGCENEVKTQSLSGPRKTECLKTLGYIADLEDQGLPQYVQMYNPWPDHFSHFAGIISDEIISPTGELNRLDFWLGKIESVFNEAGVLDRTLFGMAGDHGLSPVHFIVEPDQLIFKSLKEELNIEKQDIKTIKISSDEGEGPKLNNSRNPKSMKGYDAMIASTAGGNYMLDFFVDQDANWERQPTNNELKNLKLISGKKINIVREILDRLGNSLDYMVLRETQSSFEKSTTRVIGKRNGVALDAVINRVNDRVFYQSSDDLLDVKKPAIYKAEYYQKSKHEELINKCIIEARESDLGSWCTEDDWGTLTRFTDRPDSVVQLSHLYDTDLAGTINLFPAAGIGYNTIVPGRHAGELFHEKDAFVGFWGNQAGSKITEQLLMVQNGSIAPTLYQFLTGKRVIKNSDGWGYPSVITGKKIK